MCKNMKKSGTLYKWQKVIIWIIGILTFIGSALKNIGILSVQSSALV